MPEGVAYAVDDSRWPLVVASATAVPDEAAALEAGYAKLEAILSRRQVFALLFDMRRASSSPARRQSLHAWGERHADALKRYLVVGAVVASSSIERGFVTAALWLKTPPFPMRVFSGPDEAEAWLVPEFHALTKSTP